MSLKINIGYPRRIIPSRDISSQVDAIFIIVWSILERIVNKLQKNYYTKEEADKRILELINREAP